MQFDLHALHHAYFLLGFDASSVLHDFALARGVPVEGNPDVALHTYDTFGIDDVRALQQAVRTKPLAGHRIVVCTAQVLTHEAQHALLKLLEEPAEGTHLLFVLPQSHAILETVRSRVVIYTQREASSDIFDFVHKTPGERLKDIERMLKAENPKLIETFLRDVEG